MYEQLTDGYTYGYHHMEPDGLLFNPKMTQDQCTGSENVARSRLWLRPPAPVCNDMRNVDSHSQRECSKSKI